MPRLAIFSIFASLAALTISAAVTSAQETGGVALTPEILKANNAQGQILDHVLARAQQLQQLRQRSLSGATASSNLANPAAAPPNSTQQPLGPADALALASALRQRAITTLSGDPSYQQQIITNNPSYQQQIITNNSQSLTLNAPNSSVSIGDNNIVKQNVTTSTAISATGNATATAGAGGTTDHHGAGSNKSTSSQTAASNATSIGGTAQAVAINTAIAPQGGH